jgi:hypothetical protein
MAMMAKMPHPTCPRPRQMACGPAFQTSQTNSAVPAIVVTRAYSSALTFSIEYRIEGVFERLIVQA